MHIMLVQALFLRLFTWEANDENKKNICHYAMLGARYIFDVLWDCNLFKNKSP